MFSFLRRKSYQHLNKVLISKEALIANHHALQQIHQQAAVCPVLKGNAYGHGLREVASIFDSLRPQVLIVDSLYEAYELYKLHLKTPILILGYTIPANFTVKRLPFEITVFDLETAKILNKYQPGCRIHLFVDTGMSREGIPLDQLPAFLTELKKLKSLSIVGLCSHFADADNPDSQEFTKQQLLVYKKALKIVNAFGFTPQWRHISASAGIFKVRDKIFTLIRGGLVHYGINPLAPEDKHMNKTLLRPALAFTSTLVQVKKIPKGTYIGYNCTHKAKKTMVIGLLPAGFYEGVDRRLSNNGFVTIRKQFFPIVGRVSMNMTVIDITALQQPQIGEIVTLYSADERDKNSVAAVAKRTQTIPYDILVHIAESVKRSVS
jgi:alanine racemase